MNQTFNELYKFYQSNMLETVESAIKSKGWTIENRNYRSNYSNDIATLELFINTNEQPDERYSFYLNHTWLDFLFIDRDGTPRQIDFKILEKNYGLAKIKHSVFWRIEVLEAAENDEYDKLHALGKHSARLRTTAPSGEDPSRSKVEIHYENGIEMPKEES